MRSCEGEGGRSVVMCMTLQGPGDWWDPIVTLAYCRIGGMENMNLLARNSLRAWGCDAGEAMSADLRLNLGLKGIDGGTCA